MVVLILLIPKAKELKYLGFCLLDVVGSAHQSNSKGGCCMWQRGAPFAA